MPLLNTIDLGKSYGPRDLFDHITLSVPHRARIGLVGPNGVGKTTLFRLILGQEEPSRGRVEKSRSLQIGYLAQEAIFESNLTLWEECLLPICRSHHPSAGALPAGGAVGWRRSGGFSGVRPAAARL